MPRRVTRTTKWPGTFPCHVPAPDAPNLTQITVDWNIEADIVWVRFRVDLNAARLFTCEEVSVVE